MSPKFLVSFLCLVALLVLVTSTPIDLLDQLYAPPTTTTPSSAFEPSSEPSKPFNGSIWALLVAGSNEYYNYRHQADVCHAYQVLRAHGIPATHIVTMMFDDIAHSEENPTPGVLVNRPNGSDVYGGVAKDYVGEEVTPDMFLKVLTGDQELKDQGKRVIESGPSDHVFVYFADHGAPGLIAFPSGELTARALNSALMSMHSRRQYSKMVLYIEACESGSMFSGLLASNLNIFASTAANPTESSYACYYDTLREAYLGDVYSVNWMEDSDHRRSLGRETISSQFKLVKKETNTSHVQEYGDITLGKLHVSEFQGATRADNLTMCDCAQVDKFADAVPAHDVPLAVAARKAKAATTTATRAALTRKYEDMVAGRDLMDRAMHSLTARFDAHLDTIDFDGLWSARSPLTRHPCYERLTVALDTHCFDLSTHPYALRFLYILVNACEALETRLDKRDIEGKDDDVKDGDDLDNQINGSATLVDFEKSLEIEDTRAPLVDGLEQLIAAHCSRHVRGVGGSAALGAFERIH